jgi:hypothetical protein
MRQLVTDNAKLNWQLFVDEREIIYISESDENILTMQ